MREDPRVKCIMCNEEARTDCEYCQGTGYDLDRQDYPICPRCGAVQSTDDLYETTDRQCDECEGWMEVEVQHTLDFTTRQTDDPVTKQRKRREEYERWLAMRKAKEAPPHDA